MLAKRIIPCLDVKNNEVVKGVQFRNHIVLGNIVDLSKFYSSEGADELVLYDITASSKKSLLNKKWVTEVAKVINIPFCVAGGIKNIQDAHIMLSSGADKISINSPSINDPYLISRLADKFGVQCVVVSIDSWYNSNKNRYEVFQYTGDSKKTIFSGIETFKWIKKVQSLGAGEIVLNTMNSDGMRKGYDIIQLKKARKICSIPIISSGGAGNMKDFLDVFKKTNVDGALAASVFHKNIISIKKLKKFLKNEGVKVRICSSMKI